MFKKGEMPFAKGGKDEDDDREESRKGSKRKKMPRKMKRMATGR
jgi:hypothetical protein